MPRRPHYNFYRLLRQQGWPPAPRARHKDDVSSGPSSGDTFGRDVGLSSISGAGTDPFSLPSIASNDAGSAVSPPTGADFATAGARPPLINFAGGSFDAGGGTALPFSGSSGTPNPVTASLGTPGGITLPGAPSPTGGTPIPGTGGPSDLTNINPLQDPTLGFQPPGGGTTTELSAQQLGGKPAGTPGAAPAAPGASAGSGSVLDSLGIKNPLGAAIGAGGLAFAAIQGQQAPKYSPELLAQAKSLNAQGQQLLSYLNSGNLPPGLKASLTQATAAAKAKVISNFASQGLNTDPSQNSALAQELLSIDQQALISTAQVGQQLLQSGIAESGLSSDLYKTLANIDQTQTASIGRAIANFASSLSGGGGGINLQLAKG